MNKERTSCQNKSGVWVQSDLSSIRNNLYSQPKKKRLEKENENSRTSQKNRQIVSHKKQNPMALSRK